VGEHYLDTVGVGGSIPPAPTTSTAATDFAPNFDIIDVIDIESEVSVEVDTAAPEPGDVS
jgi:hypothetical protein